MGESQTDKLEKKQITLEQVENICNGIRPDGFSREEFVYLRKEISKIQKQRLKGVVIMEQKKGMPPVVKKNVIGRNSECFCGSKKKYKYCCLNKKNV